jgi:hypothetical protein
LFKVTDYEIRGNQIKQEIGNTDMTKLNVKQINEYRWQVTYDGSIMGDDFGYNSEAEARREIDNRLAHDARDAVRYDRPILYTK